MYGWISIFCSLLLCANDTNLHFCQCLPCRQIHIDPHEFQSRIHMFIIVHTRLPHMGVSVDDGNSQPAFGLSWNYETKPSFLGIPNLIKLQHHTQFLATPWQGSWALCVATLFGPCPEFLVISWTFLWCNNGPRATLLSNANLCGATDITQTSGAQKVTYCTCMGMYPFFQDAMSRCVRPKVTVAW